MLLSMVSLVLLWGNDDVVFKETSRVNLQLGKEFVLGFSSLLVAPDKSIYISTFANRSGSQATLYRLDKEGKPSATYSQRGQGPGEFRGQITLALHKDRLYAAERTNRVIHVFDTDLNFIREIKTDMVGIIKFANENYVGVWNPVKKPGNLCFMASAYPLKTEGAPHLFVERKTDEIPLLIQAWGDVIELEGGGYAAILGNHYKIQVFDEKFEQEGVVVEHEPGHIVPFSPYKGDRKLIGREAFDWMYTFTKIYKLLQDGDRFIVVHGVQKKDAKFVDIVNFQGEFLHKKMPMGDRIPLQWHGDVLTRIETIEGEKGDLTFALLEEEVTSPSFPNLKHVH